MASSVTVVGKQTGGSGSDQLHFYTDTLAKLPVAICYPKSCIYVLLALTPGVDLHVAIEGFLATYKRLGFNSQAPDNCHTDGVRTA